MRRCCHWALNVEIVSSSFFYFFRIEEFISYHRPFLFSSNCHRQWRCCHWAQCRNNFLNFKFISLFLIGDPLFFMYVYAIKFRSFNEALWRTFISKQGLNFYCALLLHKCFHSSSTFNYDCPADMGKSAVTQMTKMQNSAYHNEVS